jgi:hypothetical protein
MLLSLLALKQYVDKSEQFTTVMFSDSSITAYTSVYVIFIVLFGLIFSYGAARLSYFYNMNTGNSGYAMMWSILAFLFAEPYYPLYSFFLNPQSAKGRNNIPVPSTV